MTESGATDGTRTDGTPGERAASREGAASTAWPDLAGRLVPAEGGGHEHVLPIRVYFEDTDFSGLVYHTSYLRWCERGRSDYLRLLGIHHSALMGPSAGGAPAAFVVRRLEADYRRPARIDEVLEVRTRIAELSAASLWLAQRITRGADELFRVRVQVVLLGADGKPQRLDRLLRPALDNAPNGPSD